MAYHLSPGLVFSRQIAMVLPPLPEYSCSTNEIDASMNLECKEPSEEQPNIGDAQSLDPAIPQVGCVMMNPTDSVDLESKEPFEEQPNIGATQSLDPAIPKVSCVGSSKPL